VWKLLIDSGANLNLGRGIIKQLDKYTNHTKEKDMSNYNQNVGYLIRGGLRLSDLYAELMV
jgi:hypothetical protein